MLRQSSFMESHVVQAWEEDPLDTLKLIAHLRDVRDGKADRNLFHDCIAWLWQHHPLTLLANLDEIVKVSGTPAHFIMPSDAVTVLVVGNCFGCLRMKHDSKPALCRCRTHHL